MLPKVLPVPSPLSVVFYLLPLILVAVVIVVKLRTVPQEHRSSWLGALSLTLTLAAVTMIIMRFSQ